jgi:hypothetical protein
VEEIEVEPDTSRVMKKSPTNCSRILTENFLVFLVMVLSSSSVTPRRKRRVLTLCLLRPLLNCHRVLKVPPLQQSKKVTRNKMMCAPRMAYVRITSNLRNLIPSW